MISHREEKRRKMKLQSRTLILIASGNEGEERGVKWWEDEIRCDCLFSPLRCQALIWWVKVRGGGWGRRGMRSSNRMRGVIRFDQTGGLTRSVGAFTCALVVIVCCALFWELAEIRNQQTPCPHCSWFSVMRAEALATQVTVYSSLSGRRLDKQKLCGINKCPHSSY